MGFGKVLGRRLGGLFFDSNEKQLKRFGSLVAAINSREEILTAVSDDALRDTTEQLKQRLANGDSVDDVLVDAFAAIRENSKRTVGMRHFDVQLIGGIILHEGHIAEMKTGEGKTLVATLPLYLNALEGMGCHLVTVNDYLAKRDCLWMGPVYHGLGLSVACITGRQDDATQRPSFVYDPSYVSSEERWSCLRPCTRAEAYAADITYGTNNEFGFDYLRDNMVNDLSQCVQRTLHFAIVDEVDNILIDEARTPLIISAASQEAANKYVVFARVVSKLANQSDFEIDERSRSVHLTEEGTSRVEAMLQEQGLLKGPNLFDAANYMLTHYLQSALRAHALFRRDKDYVVKAGQVIIVDEFTGRLMQGRRYSEGLHQAIEAKEHVQIQHESVTHATITFQNYFRMYTKLAGMTGTAMTEAEEFSRIYELEVLEVPTNKPNVRQDLPDRVYKDEKSKFMAVVNDVAEAHATGRPVLVGTTSIETSETLSDLFIRRGLRAEILNAKNHEREANIIADAGRRGAITVATNMAGRGVDIILGGNPQTGELGEWQSQHDEVLEKGGLYVVGTEHHEARRIDNQLRGRSGRQGDPGTTCFFVSLDDDIMRRFGSDRVKSVMDWAGFDEQTPIEHPVVTKAIGNAQVQTEGYHFDIRKHLVEYDDVLNKHREIIYAERRKVLSGADLRDNIRSMLDDEMTLSVEAHFNPSVDELDRDGLMHELATFFTLPPESAQELLGSLPSADTRDNLVRRLVDFSRRLYDQREEELSAPAMRLAERFVMLKVIDGLWMEHLTAMQHMRTGIGLRAAGNQQPLVVYKKEGHGLFEGMLAGIKHDVAASMFRVSVKTQEEAASLKRPPPKTRISAGGARVGRNDPCPCGSGKKFKHCCGK